MDKLPAKDSAQTVLTEVPPMPKEKLSISTKLVHLFDHRAFRLGLFIFLTSLLFLTTFYVAYLKKEKERLESELQEALYEVPEAKVVIDQGKQNDISTTNWKEYKSEKLGISFKYPDQFEVEESDPFNIKIGVKQNTDPAGNIIAPWIGTRFYIHLSPASNASLMEEEIAITDIYEYKQTIEDVMVDGISAKKVSHRACQSADCINIFLLTDENLYTFSATNATLDKTTFDEFISSIKFVN